MNKQYVYRKHLRHPQKYLLTILAFFVIVYIAFSSIFILANNDMNRGLGITIFAIVGVVIFGIIALEFLFLYFVFFRRFKDINVTLTDDGIIYNNINGVTIIPYQDITGLNFPSVRYVGGWLKILHTKGNIKLTVVLENIGDFLKNLKLKLDSMNFSYDEKKMYNFYKTAEYSDQSWERLYEYIKWLLLYMVLNLALSALFISMGIDAGLAFLLIISSIIMPTLVFLTAEIIIGRKLAKGASREEFSVPERDRKFEAAVYKWAYSIYTVLYLAASIYLLVK